MTLADILVPHLPEGPRNAVAMDWLARWQAAGNKALSSATVESRFSDLLKEKIDGVRFFYNDAAREALLGDVLGLDDAERAGARARAQELLAQRGVQAARLVVDVSGLTRGDEAAVQMFKALKQDLFRDDTLLPAVLVVTEDQYDRLPRSFDDHGERLRKVRVADAAQGRLEAVDLAGEGAVVASPWRFDPPSRWLALAWKDGALEMGPANGPEHLRAHGRLPSPPIPRHDAAELLDDGPPKPASLPKDPVRLRRLLDALGDEAATANLGDLPTRVALATALGIRASSTESERAEVAARRERARIEAEVAQVATAVGRVVQPGTPEDLERALVRASRVRKEPVALRVGDEVHLVCGEDDEVPQLPRLTLHRVAVKPTALERLKDALAEMTDDDLRDDPLLLGVVHRLAEGHADERKLLLHARAGLVLAGFDHADPAPVEDWRGALARLLEGQPPAAKLRVDVQTESLPWVGDAKLWSWAFPDGRMFLTEVKDVPQLYWVPPVACPFLERTQRLVLFHPLHAVVREPKEWGGWTNVPRALVSTDPAMARDPERWVGLVDASPLFGGSDEAAGKAWSAHMLPAELPGWVQTTQDVPLATWNRADRELAMAWIALRRAVRGGEAVRLHDDTVLLDLGGGLLAEVEVREHGAEDAPVTAALTLGITKVRLDHGWQDSQRVRVVSAELGSLSARVDTHLAETGSYLTRLGYALPRCITLQGKGVVAEVRFVASPLLAAASSGAGAVAPLVAGLGGAVAAIADDD